MDITIYFFTGTGNSLQIARDLGEKLKNCKLIPIVKAIELENPESLTDKVGFIFPLYYSGLPKIVYDFISKIDLNRSKYFFTIITSAGGINELPLQQIGKILKVKEKNLNAGFFITMPNNFIIGYDIDSERRQKDLFGKARKQVEVISEIITNRRDNLDTTVFKKNLERSKKFNEKFRQGVLESDKSFYVDDRCSNCGICEKVCPVNNIILIDGKLQWQHKCQQCLACINFCPEESIQFGKSTLKTHRYHHPEITLQDITSQKNYKIES